MHSLHNFDYIRLAGARETAPEKADKIMARKFTKDPALTARVTGTIKLQAIGETSAIPAGDLKPGDVTIWNFGGQNTVVRIDRETAKTVWITFSYYCNVNKEVVVSSKPRRLKKDRLVGFKTWH